MHFTMEEDKDKKVELPEEVKKRINKNKALRKFAKLTGIFTGVVLILCFFLTWTGFGREVEKGDFQNLQNLPINKTKYKKVIKEIVAAKTAKIHQDSVHAFKDSVKTYKDSFNRAKKRAREAKRTKRNYYPGQFTTHKKVIERVLGYKTIVDEKAEKYDLEPNLINAIIAYESMGVNDTLSSAGAIGLMGIMPICAKQMGCKPEDMRIPEKNIEVGCAYLRLLIDKHQSIDIALVEYNMGPRRFREKLEQGLADVRENPYIKEVYKRKKDFAFITSQGLSS